MKKLGPGSYQYEKSFEKVKMDKRHKNKFKKSVERSVFDEIAKKKKFVPGVGNYKGVEKAIDKKISRPITAKMRSRR